jgi:hypothetical protein
MATFRHGKGAAVLLDGNDVSAYFNDATTTQGVGTADVTAFGATAKSYISGIEDGSMSLKGLFDGTTTPTPAIDSILNSAAGSATDNTLSVFVEGLIGGRRATMMNVQETKYEISSPVADVNAISAEFQGDGGYDSGVILDAGAKSATATSTGIDNAALSSNGGVAHYHVTANTRNGTLDMKIQHSVDNTTFVDLVTFTQVASSATGAQRQVIAGTVNRYLRANYTFGGSTGSATIAVAFARR